MNGNMRTALLIVDALALVGLLVFSVLGALHQGEPVYIAGQIVCAAVVLGTVVLTRRGRTRSE